MAHMSTMQGAPTGASMRASSARHAVTHLLRPPAPVVARNVSARVAIVDEEITRQQPTQPASFSRFTTPVDIHYDENQRVREGGYEASLVQQQAGKQDSEQQSIASALPPPDITKLLDTVVVGAGPAGLYLACELAKRGLNTAVIGLDVPIVNNYGVWLDEYRALGLDHTLELSWDDAVCYFGEGRQKRLGRGYGRVSRRKLRAHLLKICKEAGVTFLPGEVSSIRLADGGATTSITTAAGQQLEARLVTLAAGAAGGKFLRYEQDAPSVAAQTAYGIEAEVEGYDQAYPANEMLFMDFRRHHTGVWDDVAARIERGAHPNAGDGEWATNGEVPSFLYAMPLGGNRVFLEETCLVAKPALPFAVLKRRLERRLKAQGIKVKAVHEEEWSYIPVGGPLPVGDQPVAAFGAAANLVHPATGFSVSRSFREAPGVADVLAAAVRSGTGSRQAAAQVWSALWPQERRTQTAFHTFGMELLATLDLPAINAFFCTFFQLPQYMWRGYMASKLDSGELVAFALLTFLIADPVIKWKLMEHLFTDPSGQYLLNGYKRRYLDEGDADSSSSSSSTTGNGALPASAPVA